MSNIMYNKTNHAKYVHEYYNKLSKEPDRLIDNYSNESTFLHGNVYDGQMNAVIGRENVQRRLAELDYRGCEVNIHMLDMQQLDDQWCMVGRVFGDIVKANASKSNFSHSLMFRLSVDNEFIIINDLMISYYFTQQNDATVKQLTAATDDRWTVERWLRSGDEGPSEGGGGGGNGSKAGVKSPSALRIFGDSCPPISHQLYISNIPSGTKYNELKKFFEQHGPLYSLRIMKINKNFGFITYADESSAKEVLNNRPISFSAEDGVWLTVKEKRSRSDNYKKLKINLPESHQLFIGDIPDNVTVEDLRAFFGTYGTIVCARILRYSKADVPQSTHGFVTFHTRESANRVLNMTPIWYPDTDGVLLSVMEKRIVPKAAAVTCNKHPRSQPGGDHVDHDDITGDV
ncbi:uncharacterized protein LOC126837180 [Adelges cooleyi]|uniref:uncharacterized protein LOC126837180 n=1 Tax=Adelges cooleyi TaxID=133065 RepID=UPI00217F8402|nr:uncharacterized protein LOC126837180 [Adelges cooleyi]